MWMLVVSQRLAAACGGDCLLGSAVTWDVAEAEDEHRRAGCRVRWSTGVDYHNGKASLVQLPVEDGRASARHIVARASDGREHGHAMLYTHTVHMVLVLKDK